MHTLKFTLSPEGVTRVHDAVICLSKFSESVSIEAWRDKVCHFPKINLHADSWLLSLFCPP